MSIDTVPTTAPITAPTDTATHPDLIARVKARRTELEADLGRLAVGDRARLPLEGALSQIEGLMTGKPDELPKVVGEQLSVWLEASKNLGEQHT